MGASSRTRANLDSRLKQNPLNTTLYSVITADVACLHVGGLEDKRLVTAHLERLEIHHKQKHAHIILSSQLMLHANTTHYFVITADVACLHVGGLEDKQSTCHLRHKQHS